MTRYDFEKPEKESFFQPLKSKKGAAKGLTVAIAAIAVTLVIALIVGAASVLFFFANYTRPGRIEADEVVVTERTSPAEERKASDKETTKESQSNAAATLVVNTNDESEELSYSDIFKKANPATVSIYAQVQQEYDFWGVQAGEATGSGFIITEDGHIVTNAHVISGAKDVEVQIPGFEERIPAEVVGSDTSTDIAILKVNEKGLPFVELGTSGDVIVGEEVVAIGNPLGQLSGTMTNGIISARDREVQIETYKYNLFQTNAEINPGNSGGPLLNMRGQVIGVTNAKASASEGIGFAIPIDDIRPTIDDLIEHGYVRGRPLIGLTSQPIDEYTALKLDTVPGLYVMSLESGGPAEKAGMMKGDVITGVNGVEIMTQQELTDIRDDHEVGDELVFAINRNGDEIEITVELGEFIPK